MCPRRLQVRERPCAAPQESTPLRPASLATQFDSHGKKLPRGYWSISQRGIDFLEGRLRIQAGIRTFNKKIVKNSAFGPMVGVRDFLKKEPDWKIDSPEPPAQYLLQGALIS